MIKFLQPLSSLVKQTYDTSPAEMTGINKAFSYNLRNAITGVYRAFTVDYAEAVNRWIFRQNTAARNAGTYILDVTAFSGKAVQTYIGFISADGSSVSNSLFTGQVNVL